VAGCTQELDYPCASGLLALIFKEWFGTVDRCVLESLSKIESLPEKQRIGETWRESDAVLVIDIMRRKAVPLNVWFGTNRWTPHKMATTLWTSRSAWAEIHEAQMVGRRSDEQIPPQS
jgi:hypothetical protein